jgi:hypothetical protein
MAATPTAFLVFYRFKAMNDQEAQKASAEWGDLKRAYPLMYGLQANTIMRGVLNTMDS